ncbi:extensin-like [Salvia miltiorrhiza]|uniref:extensin-like n=1 Tax=Salvia miltiorrhiza TaxID=226208 RepID=UPI0025AD8726|nr:extensin-like [Salvia miltiorrhiza]
MSITTSTPSLRRRALLPHNAAAALSSIKSTPALTITLTPTPNNHPSTSTFSFPFPSNLVTSRTTNFFPSAALILHPPESPPTPTKSESPHPPAFFAAPLPSSPAQLPPSPSTLPHDASAQTPPTLEVYSSPLPAIHPPQPMPVSLETPPSPAPLVRRRVLHILTVSPPSTIDWRISR